MALSVQVIKIIQNSNKYVIGYNFNKTFIRSILDSYIMIRRKVFTVNIRRYSIFIDRQPL